ncbi:nitroreductase family protein [Desulfurispirillum indicum]|uniref:Nitroreductase n=1 Tax=Desulfurispirillum indicum (strain ATCC BAA-1389 / DSM 22839 / S5) TaxID=653733 RepID=E6W459_DESIS|nr:nitroreductase family protein [Desulfurispirillum indicum]ADU67023.1 nitroreductase [Desulfurispirillum indicum S5]UCZ56255.1 nitroreductase family protein [Desulfurispirillum indicum]
MNIIDILKKRRTQYALGKTLPMAENEVDALIREVVRQAPSSFNSQSSRVVILFGRESEKLWSIVKETLRAIVPAENFASTDAKIDSFAAGAGTILFFEDQDAVRELQQQFPLYAENFPTFSEQSGGMAQFAVWTALANVGIGASLQHYNPLIDEEVARTWGLPASWKLRAQMPFGSNEQPIDEKTFIDDAIRFRTFR